MDEQLNDVMNAILDGKYSWACVLWLRARGYNPKEYIPCRTYNRLLKQQKMDYQDSSQSEIGPYPNNSSSDTQNPKISDLPYLNDDHTGGHSTRGGLWLARLQTRSRYPLVSRRCIP